MLGQQFYHETMRKVVVAFGTIFNNINIVRKNNSGTIIQKMKVPLAYGPKQKFLTRLDNDPSLNKKVAVTLPRIGFEIANLAYDPVRKLNRVQRFKKVKSSDKDKLDEALKRAGRDLCATTKRKELDDPYLWYWVSIYDENDDHGSHNHPGSLLSGTYWPSCDETSSPILLTSPTQTYQMHDRLPNQDFIYQPQPGDMLMWPSWVEHRVHKQKKPNKPRIAISFNLDYNWAKIRKHHD